MKRACLGVLLLAMGLGVASPAEANCGFELTVKNESTQTFTVTKISTAMPVGRLPKVYKRQWEGTRRLAPGATSTFSFTVDFCPSSTARFVKVFYTAPDNPTTYEDVEFHPTGETQTLN